MPPKVNEKIKMTNKLNLNNLNESSLELVRKIMDIIIAMSILIKHNIKYR